MTGSLCIVDGLKYANVVYIDGVVSHTLRTVGAIRFLLGTKAHGDRPDGGADFSDTVMSVVYYGEADVKDGDNIGVVGWLRQVRYCDQLGNPLLAAEVVAERLN